jgi:integrase/recombinase XerD
MKIKKPVFSIMLRTTNPLSDGRYPVVIRATFDRKRQYYSLGMSATLSEWNATLGRFQAKRLTEEQRKANHLLDDYSRSLKDLGEYFSQVEFTFERFKERFFKSASGNVLEYFDRVITELEAQDRLGSARSYTNTRDKLKEFKKNFVFQDIDKKFLQKFEEFILKTCSPSTAGIYLRTLRAVYNRAITDNLAKRDIYPFTDYKIKTVKGRKKALTKEQIQALKDYKAPNDSRLRDSLNLFLFSYYARGMNLMDIASLKWSNIRNGRIYYQRQKTADNLDLLIDSNLAEILTQYNGKDFIFPILETGLLAKTARYRIHAKLKKINEDLRSIASTKELPNDITFYWARHTYATTLKRAGVSVSVIQETLGHSSEQVTKNYLDSFETDQLDEISKYL